jgi:hypothetical protein
LPLLASGGARFAVKGSVDFFDGAFYPPDTIYKMNDIAKYIGIGLAGAVLAGFTALAVIILHPATKPSAISVQASPTASSLTGGTSQHLVLNSTSPSKIGGPQIAVVANGNQGSVLNSSTGADTQTTAQLPEPSGFSVYDSYKNDTETSVAEIISGTGVAIVKGSHVRVNYRAYLTNGKKFDDTYDKNKPFEYTEASGSIIAGFLEGMIGMQVGGKRRLIIPPAVGYGTKGEGPIPPNSVIIFDVELISVQ